jgi:mono/diheme cytochrome c family protein
MKNTLKWIGISLGALLVIILAVFYIKGNALVARHYTIVPENVTIPTDAAALARGKHFVDAICRDCHTPDLSGKNMINAPFANIDSANITPSPSGAVYTFKDADWVRVLRHGVDDQGRALVIMPAQEFWYFSDQDLGDIIAYVKTVLPVEKSHHDPQTNFLGKIMFGAGLFGPDVVPANVIDHTQRPTVVPVGVTSQYGNYLVNVSGCHDCHGAQLAGGKSAKPGAMDAPNLTPGGDLKTWGKAEFINTVRTGVTPNGHQLKATEMPWKLFGTYTDDELSAVFLYLQSLQPLKTIKP